MRIHITTSLIGNNPSTLNMIKGEKSREHKKKIVKDKNSKSKIKYKLRFIYQAIFIDLLPLPSREMDLFI